MEKEEWNGKNMRLRYGNEKWMVDAMLSMERNVMLTKPPIEKRYHAFIHTDREIDQNRA